MSAAHDDEAVARRAGRPTRRAEPWDIINPIDVGALREQFRGVRPFPFFCLDRFFDEDFDDEVLAAFPSYDAARQMGREFRGVNERGKVQVTDATRFAEPIRRINVALAAPAFLDVLSEVTGIDRLLADDRLVGGGIQQTGARGHLDVHIDFNYIRQRDLHRRLNILVYLNKVWPAEWGGHLELWDAGVTRRAHLLAPIFNRCVVFETSEVSFHGVSAVTCPPEVTRKSFAAYYYTREAPAHWTGKTHDTVFRARPDERWKGRVLMPLARTTNLATRVVKKVVRTLRHRRGASGLS
jgi:2-oxoglutarate-Fe(II)-dependent oxygenase superfamily protein